MSSISQHRQDYKLAYDMNSAVAPLVKFWRTSAAAARRAIDVPVGDPDRLTFEIPPTGSYG